MDIGHILESPINIIKKKEFYKDKYIFNNLVKKKYIYIFSIIILNLISSYQKFNGTKKIYILVGANYNHPITS